MLMPPSNIAERDIAGNAWAHNQIQCRVLNGSDVADWALVAPRAENGTVAKISN